MSALAGCSTQQLAEFLAAVSSFPEERAAIIGALDRAAAAFEAEAAAVVRDGSVEASIGFRGGKAPAAELAAAAEEAQAPREIPGLGRCCTASVPLEEARRGALVLARLGEDRFSPEELNLLRAMARVLELALRMLGTVAKERELRRDAEEQANERQRAERRLATQHAVARVLAASATPEVAFVPVLRTLARELGAVSGAVWLTDEREGSLRAAGAWHSSSTGEPQQGPFDSAQPGGLVSGVLSEGTAAWEPGSPASERAAGARRAGLAFPIADGPHVMGVIELRGREVERPDPAVLEMLTGVGANFSQFLTRRRAEQQLAHQALHDSLTGLPNRTLLLDRIGHASERAIRSGTVIAVLFLDIDRFKNVNDSLGHQAGDGLLMAFAERLTGILRATDTVTRLNGTVARLAGDEFVVLCEDLSDEHDAVRVAERISRASGAPFHVRDNELEVSVSIGIAVSSGQESAEQLIRDADLAMYRAKEEGRDRYELFDAPMRTRVLDRIELEKDLRKALERDQLQLDYQPLVSIRDRSIVGAEALLRWQHPERGLVPPLEFVPIAEDSTLVLSIGEWVLKTACRQLAAWTDAGTCPAGFGVSVNLSPKQLTPGLPALVADAVQATGIQPSSLSIEITESLLVEEAESPAELLRDLKSLGVRLVLDDFGTGYSSLSYLHRFELDGLKLDRSFISRLGSDPSGSKLVAASIEMARALDLTVVAEGVETEQQLARLRELSCPLGQGYLFARPGPAHELERRLQLRPPTPMAEQASLA